MITLVAIVLGVGWIIQSFATYKAMSMAQEYESLLRRSEQHIEFLESLELLPAFSLTAGGGPFVLRQPTEDE